MLIDKNIVARFLVVGMFLLSFCAVSVSFAQDTPQNKALKDASKDSSGGSNKLDPKDYKKWKKEFVPHDVDKLAFSDDQSGCGTRMAFKNMLIGKYSNGEQPEDIAISRIMGDYVKKEYAAIREKGVNQATYDTMSEYQDCMKNVEPVEDPSKAYDMEQRFGACGEVNGLVLNTLDAIKKRKSMDSVLNKYKGKKAPDLSGTTYGATEDAIEFIVGRIYKEAQTSNFEAAVSLGSKLSYACYM